MLDPAQVRVRVEETIDAFDLRELADRRVDRISMGQRQRLRIAMTFLTKPEVVLLDEPLTSLDAEGAEILERAIAELIDAAGARCSGARPAANTSTVDFDARWVLAGGKAGGGVSRPEAQRSRLWRGDASRPPRLPLLPNPDRQPGC